MSLTASHPTSPKAFDVQSVREDFPILGIKVHGKPLVYLDNGATTQKPQAVLDAIKRYYESENANIHRALHTLSQTATRLYEEARETVRAFINAGKAEEIIFTRGTTEGINLVASSYGQLALTAGDEVIVSTMEHHSNIVPWQIACQRAGATLKVIPMTDAGELILDEYAALLNDRTKIVSIVHVSNSLGTINPVEQMIKLARQKSPAKIMLDGAQHVAHFPTDVQKLDCDFYAFSGHKLYGPTGIGILYGRKELLNAMPPYQGGGDMIESVTFAKTTYAPLPNKFEAGTPHIAGVVGLAAGIGYVQSIGLERIARYEHDLLEYAQSQVAAIPGVRVIGSAKHKADIVSFIVENPPISTFDLGQALDREGVAVRTGHHCCQPVMDRLGISATTRASLAMYNTKAEVDVLVESLKKIILAAKMKQQSAPATKQDNRAESVEFPPKFADSPTAAADAIVADFELFDDPESKNQYLEDLGENLPYMPAGLKTDATRVHGCMSIVHLYPREKPGSVMEFVADSDASTVRGLIGTMQRLFSGQRTKDILAFDVEQFLKRIGIEKIVTTRRRIGLDALIKRIREESLRIVSRAQSS